MSRSKKKTPASTIACCKSQKADKRICNRVFRRRSKILLAKGRDLPIRLREVMDVWGFAGDGKRYWGDDCRFFKKLMRK